MRDRDKTSSLYPIDAKPRQPGIPPACTGPQPPFRNLLRGLGWTKPNAWSLLALCFHIAGMASAPHRPERFHLRCANTEDRPPESRR